MNSKYVYASAGKMSSLASGIHIYCEDSKFLTSTTYLNLVLQEDALLFALNCSAFVAPLSLLLTLNIINLRIKGGSSFEMLLVFLAKAQS